MIKLVLAIAMATTVAMALDQPLYLFDNGAGRGKLPLADQVKLAGESGYAGLFYTGTRDIDEVIALHKGRKLKMVGIYTGMHLNDATPAADPGLEKAIERLKGSGALITFTINGKRPDIAAADALALPVLQQVADWAAKAGLQVALYPHHGFHIARIEDAIRLIEKSGRKNIGLVFNLCHWLRSGDGDHLDERLRQALPFIRMVSINGADPTGDWPQLIQQLDQGSYDVRGFTRKLIALGYKGPFALQCYNVQGDITENAKRSIAAWRKF